MYLFDADFWIPMKLRRLDLDQMPYCQQLNLHLYFTAYSKAYQYHSRFCIFQQRNLVFPVEPTNFSTSPFVQYQVPYCIAVLVKMYNDDIFSGLRL
jgi:hypothetical protein